MTHVDSTEDSQVMTNGDYLLTKLEETNIPWLIIHGHKHYPQIFYNRTSTSSPTVTLSAGSVSAVLYTAIKERTSNQYYILDIDLEKTESTGIVTGEFYVKSYNIASGWHDSAVGCLPSYGGFGDTTPEKIIVSKFKTLLGSKKVAPSGDIDEYRELIKFITPEQKKKIIELLNSNNIHIEFENNRIVEVGKIA